MEDRHVSCSLCFSGLDVEQSGEVFECVKIPLGAQRTGANRLARVEPARCQTQYDTGTGSTGGNEIPDYQSAAAELHQVQATIIFPSARVGAVSELREDLVMPQLGLPADLNGDGVIDGLNHAGDYTLLPVQIRVQWVTPDGPRSFSVFSVLSS